MSGCGFLSSREIEQAIENRLPADRRAQFEEHLAGGCSDCLLFSEDLATFRRLASGGLLDAEKKEADRLAEPLRTLLRAALRRDSSTRSS